MMTEAQIHEWVLWNQDFARSTFEEKGRVLPMAVAMATYNPATKKAYDRPGQIVIANAGGFDENDKQHYVQKVREICKNHKAYAALFMCEAWIAWDMDEAVYEKYRGKLDTAPGRGEVVFITLQLRGKADSRIWFAKITRDGKKAELGPFLEQGPKAGAGGRFADLLDYVSTQ